MTPYNNFQYCLKQGSRSNYLPQTFKAALTLTKRTWNCYISNCWQGWLLSTCSCYIIFLCLSQSHRWGRQGLLLTCNNSRGYGFPPLTNLTPGSSPRNSKAGDRTHQTGWVIWYSMKLSAGEHRNVPQKEQKEILWSWLW